MWDNIWDAPIIKITFKPKITAKPPVIIILLIKN